MGLLTYDPRRLVAGLLGMGATGVGRGSRRAAASTNHPGLTFRKPAPFEMDGMRAMGLPPFVRLPEKPDSRSQTGPKRPLPPAKEEVKTFDPYSLENFDLGVNNVYKDLIVEAATRSGRSPFVIASIVNAEALPDAKGVWDPKSRNLKSSARGLTQFTAGTWLGEAERPGTMLHDTAAKLGYLDKGGRVRPQHRKALLDLRFDPRLSITAAADYVDHNLDGLERAEFIPKTLQDAATYAYIAHHHGLRGAKEHFQGEHEIDEGKFAINVPKEKQAEYLQAHKGDWSKAYSAYYRDYSADRVSIDNFRKDKRAADRMRSKSRPLRR